MRIHILLTILLMALVSFYSISSAYGAENKTITGTISKNGIPLEHIDVTVTCATTRILHDTTDSSGMYSVTFPSSNCSANYTISVSFEYNGSPYSSPLGLKAGTSGITVDFPLTTSPTEPTGIDRTPTEAQSSNPTITPNVATISPTIDPSIPTDITLVPEFGILGMWLPLAGSALAFLKLHKKPE